MSYIIAKADLRLMKLLYRDYKVEGTRKKERARKKEREGGSEKERKREKNKEYKRD